jgi:uncharacterized membrane-anchored protein
MAAGLAGALAWQFRAQRYIPKVYWLAVVLISVVGTLATDNLVDNFGIPLAVTTSVFAVCLAATFALWYRSERTLSIHTIYTTRREAFYWTTILFTFALGTAAGDLVSEKLDVGYWRSGLMFGALIAVIVLTAARHDGGLGLGTNATSAVFLVIIVGLVAYLTKTGRDAPRELSGAGDVEGHDPVLKV